MTVQNLCEALGKTHVEVSKALNPLRKVNLVTRESMGSYRLYTLNKELWNELCSDLKFIG